MKGVVLGVPTAARAAGMPAPASPRNVWSRTRRRTWSGSGTKVPAAGANTAVVSTRVGLRTRMLSRGRPRATRGGAFRITRSFNLSSTMSSSRCASPSSSHASPFLRPLTECRATSAISCGCTKVERAVRISPGRQGQTASVADASLPVARASRMVRAARVKPLLGRSGHPTGLGRGRRAPSPEGRRPQPRLRKAAPSNLGSRSWHTSSWSPPVRPAAPAVGWTSWYGRATAKALEHARRENLPRRRCARSNSAPSSRCPHVSPNPDLVAIV